MIHGLRGSLLSHEALEAAAQSSRVAAPTFHMRGLERWRDGLVRDGGPSWSHRLVFDRVAAPIASLLGFDLTPAGGGPRCTFGRLQRNGGFAAAAVAFGWGQDAGATWRDSVRIGIGAGARWCFCFAGPVLRIFDAQRTHSRRFVEFDLIALAGSPSSAALALPLLADAAALDRAVLASERHRSLVRAALQAGVHDALEALTGAFATAARRGRGAASGRAVLDESLVVVYRVLFLLFAEARGLVPTWHPVFRESYTVESFRPAVERTARPPGLWEALQAIARLAHTGCRAGTLRVAPFNGRLFSPHHAPLAASVPLDDGAVRQALLALTTRPSAAGRERITYADLGVEQLGGVYERVLDYDITRTSDRGSVLVRGTRRKATGTFYTPRSLTEYLVRRTLAPLVTEAPPDRILALRVLDPAMGSGAFLVAACRYLAAAYETALIEEGTVTGGDLSEHDRAEFRRLVARRCLFGIDANPMAVELARLSLWLATLSGDRPLTFLDHQLRAGNSLVGAGIDDVRAARPGRRRVARARPLFEAAGIDAAIRSTAASLASLREGLEDTLSQVRAKERLVAGLTGSAAPLAAWKALADLWCAGWFDPAARAVDRTALSALFDDASGRPSALPRTTADQLLRLGAAAARQHRFFHWELEFPDVFASDGPPDAHRGFDAIVGNPPWEMLRGDTGDADARRSGAAEGSALTRFARGSGIYRLQGGGQANLYQLFVERSFALLHRSGRLGLVLPSGLATDQGSAALRRHLFRSTAVDSFVVVENTHALFPVHRGLKFVLMTLTASGGTAALPLRCGLKTADEFDRLPALEEDRAALRVPLGILERLSGPQLAVPDLRTARDLTIAARLSLQWPHAAAAAGWGLRFGRELNATDDRHLFTTDPAGLPVVEGKQVRPFVADLGASRHFVSPDAASRALRARPFDRRRVVYRDVAAATNRLTLIAAVLPAGAVTSHTLFCLRTALDDDALHVVAGLLNSFVANYLVRQRVTTHVSVSIVERLPLPKAPARSPLVRAIGACASHLAEQPEDAAAYARLQGAAARLYGLDHDEFAHVLSTFPLIEPGIRAAALSAFVRTI